MQPVDVTGSAPLSPPPAWGRTPASFGSRLPQPKAGRQSVNNRPKHPMKSRTATKREASAGDSRGSTRRAGTNSLLTRARPGGFGRRRGQPQPPTPDGPAAGPAQPRCGGTGAGLQRSARRCDQLSLLSPQPAGAGPPPVFGARLPQPKAGRQSVNNRPQTHSIQYEPPLLKYPHPRERILPR